MAAVARTLFRHLRRHLRSKLVLFTRRPRKKSNQLYPQIAKNTGVSGLVRVKLVIDESGSVANILWTEGPLVLRQAAQDAVRQWKFQPVVIDGKPVRASGYIDFGFSR